MSNFRCSSLLSCVVFRTGLWATHVVLGGDLLPAGTVLVTPALEDHQYLSDCIVGN